MSLSRIASNAPSHSPGVQNASVLGTILRYFLPFIAVAIACGATHLLDIAAAESPNLFLFFGSIVITAWFAGAGPGWLAVTLSILAADYFFSPPIYVLDLSTKDIPWFTAFALCAIATNALSLKRRRMEAILRHAHDELEQRVRERTRDLQQSNDKLTAATKERTLVEAALRETQNELARAARIMTVTELTASIAHEVNQPLSAVVANGEAEASTARTFRGQRLNRRSRHSRPAGLRRDQQDTQPDDERCADADDHRYQRARQQCRSSRSDNPREAEHDDRMSPGSGTPVNSRGPGSAPTAPPQLDQQCGRCDGLRYRQRP
jgi:K+-sensing histidine kinase KdpD